MRLIVTSGRDYADAECMASLLDRTRRACVERLQVMVVVHGACGVDLGTSETPNDDRGFAGARVTGGDGLAHRWALWRQAEGHDVAVEAHPATWTTPVGMDRSAGPRRNAGMVATLGPGDVCLSFPGGRGTADCTQRATAAGVWVGAPVREHESAPWDIRWWHRDGRSRGPAFDGRASKARSAA